MYVAMNRFAIKPEHADAFEAAWKGRQSYLDGVPGIDSFRLLRNGSEFVSFSLWRSRGEFETWTRSEEFHLAHSQSDTRHMHERGPRFTGYEVVVEQSFGE